MLIGMHKLKCHIYIPYKFPQLFLSLSNGWVGRTVETSTQDSRHHGFNAERRPQHIRDGVGGGGGGGDVMEVTQ